MLETIESRVKRWIADQKSSPLIISDIFIRMSKHLGCYSLYVNNFDHAVAVLNDSKKIYPVFAQFCKRVEASPECNFQELESYLINPVQQLPRYILLLNDILRATSSEHPDYSGLEEALDKIRKLAVFVNEKKREAEDAAGVISVLQKITRKRPDLLVRTRRFVKEGPLGFGENGHIKYKEGYVFLFSDIIVFTSKIASKNEFTYRGQLSLQNAAVDNFKSDTKFKFGILLKAERTFLLVATTLEEKNTWIRVIVSAIFAHNS